jgi:hypothetical protein
MFGLADRCYGAIRRARVDSVCFVDHFSVPATNRDRTFLPIGCKTTST